MIRLNNIRRENDIISANVTTVEMQPITFKFAFNLVTNEIVENTYGEMSMSAGMAIGKLIKLAQENGHKLLKTSESVCY